MGDKIKMDEDRRYYYGTNEEYLRSILPYEDLTEKEIELIHIVFAMYGIATHAQIMLDNIAKILKLHFEYYDKRTNDLNSIMSYLEKEFGFPHSKLVSLDAFMNTLAKTEEDDDEDEHKETA